MTSAYNSDARGYGDSAVERKLDKVKEAEMEVELGMRDVSARSSEYVCVDIWLSRDSIDVLCPSWSAPESSLLSLFYEGPTHFTATFDAECRIEAAYHIWQCCDCCACDWKSSQAQDRIVSFPYNEAVSEAVCLLDSKA